MNKRMLEKALNMVIYARRLNDNREQHPVEWLLKARYGARGYPTNLAMIKGAILCMDKFHPNYQDLSAEDKLKVEVLIMHSDLVDTIISTVFQWFGTNVGKNEIGNLMDEIRKLEYVPPVKKENEGVPDDK